MKKLLIFGNGGQGKVVLDCALCEGRFDQIAFLVSYNVPDNNRICNIKYYNEMECDIEKLRNEYSNIIIALGDNTARMKKQMYFCEKEFHIETLIHPSAVVSRFSHIGEGTVIFANSVVNPFSTIGAGCILNTRTVVEHDSVLENGVHLSPGVSMGGTVQIGTQTWIGVGSSIKNGVHIGSNSIIGMGSVVTHDIPSNVVAYGNPCKIIKGVKR